MKKLDNLQNVAESMILAIIPVLITSLGRTILGDKLLTIANVSILVISYLVSAVCIYYFNKYISKIRYFRQYKEYEGKWVEIIPGFSREIAICTLQFKSDGYHFSGQNYQNSNSIPVTFESSKFIENGKKSFYYIIKCNLNHRPEGYGKISFISKTDEGYYKGNGYFFDVSALDDPEIHNTILIKFDKNFYSKVLKIPEYENPEKFTDRDIYNHVKEYVYENFLSEKKV